MAAAVETMAFAGEVPWHGLGVPVEDTMTPEEMLEAAGLNWTVSRRPAYTIKEPVWHENVGLVNAEGHHFIVRDTDNSVLSACQDKYVPFQNADTFKFFKKFVSNGAMKMETAGSLKNGQDIWGLAKLESSFELPGGDRIEGYLLIDSPHVAGKALTILFTPIRVVCSNTMALALGGDGKRFRVLHLQAFDDDIMKAAEEALGISETKMAEFQEQTTFLSSKKAKPIDIQKFIAELLQPELLIERAKLDIANDVPFAEQFNRTAEQVHDAIALSPGADLTSAKGTWWGALNGVTYVMDHTKRESERVKGGALYSTWLGPNAVVKRRALDLATEYAKTA
jgi:phage/plasmid-like protein (TIGR03299 family)|tara:strand:- start:380 stop:1393 length:1014 start_codon:yes stop_codon:yes gene_type:complete